MKKQRFGFVTWLLGLVIVVSIGFGLRKSIDWLESTSLISSVFLEVAGWVFLILLTALVYLLLKHLGSKLKSLVGGATFSLKEHSPDGGITMVQLTFNLLQVLISIQKVPQLCVK